MPSRSVYSMSSDSDLDTIYMRRRKRRLPVMPLYESWSLQRVKFFFYRSAFLGVRLRGVVQVVWGGVYRGEWGASFLYGNDGG